jgi:uncharacterized glyoxalase superfamily protein PhnB
MCLSPHSTSGPRASFRDSPSGVSEYWTGRGYRGNDDPAAPGISVEVDDVDAVHDRAVQQGLEIAYPLRDEDWGVRRFMLREPGGTMVNVLSHRRGSR